MNNQVDNEDNVSDISTAETVQLNSENWIDESTNEISLECPRREEPQQSHNDKNLEKPDKTLQKIQDFLKIAIDLKFNEDSLKSLVNKLKVLFSNKKALTELDKILNDNTLKGNDQIKMSQIVNIYSSLQSIPQKFNETDDIVVISDDEDVLLISPQKRPAPGPSESGTAKKSPKRDGQMTTLPPDGMVELLKIENEEAVENQDIIRVRAVDAINSSLELVPQKSGLSGNNDKNNTSAPLARNTMFPHIATPTAPDHATKSNSVIPIEAVEIIKELPSTSTQRISDSVSSGTQHITNPAVKIQKELTERFLSQCREIDAIEKNTTISQQKITTELQSLNETINGPKKPTHDLVLHLHNIVSNVTNIQTSQLSQKNINVIQNKEVAEVTEKASEVGNHTQNDETDKCNRKGTEISHNSIIPKNILHLKDVHNTSKQKDSNNMNDMQSKEEMMTNNTQNEQANTTQEKRIQIISDVLINPAAPKGVETLNDLEKCLQSMELLNQKANLLIVDTELQNFERLRNLLQKLNDIENSPKMYVLLPELTGHKIGPKNKIEKYLNENIGVDGSLPTLGPKEVLKYVIECNEEFRYGWDYATTIYEAHYFYKEYSKYILGINLEKEWTKTITTVSGGTGIKIEKPAL